MKPTPLYRAEDSSPAYQLRYVWSAWSAVPPLPQIPSDDWWRNLAEAWEADGMRPLESRWADEQLQVTFSTQPQVAPIVLAGRAKGRIEHALRSAGQPCRFSRKLAERSIGEPSTETALRYIAQQVRREPFADERFRARLQRLVCVNSARYGAIVPEQPGVRAGTASRVVRWFLRWDVRRLRRGRHPESRRRCPQSGT